jgi:hypothetical protein
MARRRPAVDIRVRLKSDDPVDMLVAEALGKLCAGDTQSRASAARNLMLIGWAVVSGGDARALVERWKLGAAPTKELLRALLAGDGVNEGSRNTTHTIESRPERPLPAIASAPVINPSPVIQPWQANSVTESSVSAPAASRVDPAHANGSGAQVLNKLRQMGRTYRREDIQA